MRDQRTMSHMDSETRLVHTRLEQWGRWTKTSQQRAWPTVTLLGRIIDQGVSGAAQGGKEPLLMPAHIEAVEIAILRLPARDREVVTAYYTLWEPPEVVARKVRMSRRQLKDALHRSRLRVGCYIDAIENRLKTATVCV